jgi:PAS domain S-box-containing protein
VADEAVARANTLFQQTLLGDAAEHARVGVMVWNEERRYVAANETACELIGVSRATLLGSKVGDANPTAEARQAIDAVLDQLPTRGTTRLPSGVEVEWLVVATNVAGLPHFCGLMWPKN